MTVAKPALMTAYDYETTRIRAGTPQPLYITAFGASMHYASRIDAGPAHDPHRQHRLILRNQFLTEANRGQKFIAWNGNNFDAYFIAAALVTDPDLIIKPYLTRSNAVRGLRVSLASEIDSERVDGWEFLDGMAMLGLVGVSLAKFLDNFAPEFPKNKGAIDFEREEFDPENPTHQAYAMRDSEGLYHAMQRAQNILLDAFNQPLTVTMGGACIKIFQANIPEDIKVQAAKPEVLRLIRSHVMRGGYCVCMKRYSGPVWKYDLNQAYAAAMRETRLPAGNCNHSTDGINGYAICYIARLTATNPANTVPFYYRTEIGGRMKARFALDRIEDTWLTSIEVDQLKSEGWRVQVSESYYWDDYFTMREYVDKLETGRAAAVGGPSGPRGTVYKNVGNHSYGKTVEQNEPYTYVLAPKAPPGFAPYYPDNEDDPLPYVWWRQLAPDEQRAKSYHQPQLGAFITAHVRMVVRRAARLAPADFLYADTDCVVFASDVTARLDIDPKRYGAWKVEEAGTRYQIIAKKVYTQDADEQTRRDWHDPDKQIADAARKNVKRSAKGLNVRKLSPEDFDAWASGQAPEQHQVQRNNFLSVMHGAEMYRDQKRKGTAVEALEAVGAP